MNVSVCVSSRAKLLCLCKIPLFVQNNSKFVTNKNYFYSSFIVKMSFVMIFLLLFLPKSSDVVAMATDVELNELALDFLFLHDH